MIKNNIIIISKTNYIHSSPSKFNKLLYYIRGKNYIIALNFLKQFSNNISLIIWKTLYSAVLNAINIYKLKKQNLKIIEASINQGSISKRKKFRSKGRLYLIQKKMSHLTIKLINL